MFKKNEFLILDKLASVILPEEKINHSSSYEIRINKQIENLVRYCAPHFICFIRISLFLINLYSLFRFAHWFTNLPILRAKKMIDEWSRSTSYIKYLLLRPLLVIIYTGYYADPDVAASVGFKTPPQKSISNDKDLSSGIFNHQDVKNTIETEICVIGSGAGGAVVAMELAGKGHEVLIIEEGKYYKRSFFNEISTLERNQQIYHDAGLVTTIGFPMILLPTGKAIGGTTIINSGTCFRTPEDVLESWMKKFDLRGISSKELAPYFERVEKKLKILPVQEAVLGGNNLKIDLGAKALHLNGFPLARNAENCEGSGLCIFGCPTGAKQSTERSYLPDAIQFGARILAQARVVTIKHDHSQASSLIVEVLDDQGRVEKLITIKAKKIVIACGTLESPLLLKRSGLDGVSGQLGKNLSIHPTAKMMGLFDEEVGGDFGVPQGYGIDDYENRGMMFESVFFPPWLLATSIFQSGEAHWNIMKNYRKIGIFGFLVHDDSRGRVIAGPKGRPLIFYNLGSKEKALFVEGLKVLGRLFFAAGAKKVYPTLRTMHEITNQETLEKLTPANVKRRDLESAAFHPLGTCRMGGNRNKSVVDGNLKLHDLKNVWVVDGSVLPTSLGVNPQVTIMAFATRAAEEIHRSL